MTKQEYIDAQVEKRMAKVGIVRDSKCMFPDAECSNAATHNSTYDGTPLCASHIDAYMNFMRSFFTKEAVALAEKYFKDEKNEQETVQGS